MALTAIASFETAIGACGIAWRDDRIVGTTLPAGPGACLMDQLRSRYRAAEERELAGPAQSLAAMIVRHLAGGSVIYDAAPIALDEAPEFERLVYAAALAIPHGDTRTYGEIAAAIGFPKAAQAVGQALGRNPWPIVVPCHRVLAAGGSGGFSAPGGVTTKMRLLEIERARRGNQPCLFEELAWMPRPRST